MATLSIAAILAESAQRYPDRVAVVLGPQKVTYEELWREVRLYATVLRDRGIGPGDRVALLIPNVPDFPRFYYAVLVPRRSCGPRARAAQAGRDRVRAT